MKTSKSLFIIIITVLLLLTAACDGSGDSHIRTPEDVAGRRIGVIAGSAAETVAAAIGEATAYSSDAGMLGELRAGVIDCALIEGHALKAALKGQRGVKSLNEPLESLGFCIVAAKQSKALTADVNRALRTLTESGILPSIIANYIDGKPYTYAPRTDIPEDAGTLRLAVGGTFSSYIMLDENDEYCGLDIDVALAVCDRLGVNLEIVTFEPSAVLNAVWTGKADFAIGALYPTPQREELVDFSNPYMTTDLRVIVRR